MSVPEILQWDQAYNRNGDGKLPRAVVNVIRTYMDNDTLTGWVSQETLTQDTGLSESQVRRQIRANVEAGWLQVVKRGCVGKATDYRLTYPKPVIDDRLSDAPEETNTGHIRPVFEAELNRSYPTGNSSIPVIDDRFKPVMDDTPTSPRTSPKGSSLEGTTHEPATEGNPWAFEPTWRAEVIAREERAQEMEPATAGVLTDSPWD